MVSLTLDKASHCLAGIIGPCVRQPVVATQPRQAPPFSSTPFPTIPAVTLQRLRTVSHFKLSPHSRAFRKRCFPAVSDHEWHDWRWQLRHRIKDLQALESILRLSDDERHAILRHQGSLPVGITPYHASLLDADAPYQRLRLTVVPVNGEDIRMPGETDDPLAEDARSPVPGLVHRYPDRVLFLTTGFCPVYCRYCTRSRMVGHPGGEYRFSTEQWERAASYIEATSTIRDVLLSGGDPLTLSDDRLAWLLARLRRIPHVDLLRIGTTVPAVLPQRITPALVRLLRRFHPLWMSLHFTHADELTPEVRQACERLADARSAEYKSLRQMCPKRVTRREQVA
jgi:lysine 2,3-aminomutase